MLCKIKNKTYQYDKGNYGQANQQIAALNWDQLLTEPSVEENWTIFEKHMSEIIEKNIPYRTQSKNGKLKKKPLWMNNSALDKVRRKNTAFKKYLNSREDQDYSEYCIERNKARKATRQAVKDFEKLIAKEAKRNPKAFHKYVNSKTKVRSGISELETNDGLAISDQEKSEALNTFFTSVFTKEDLTEIPTCVTHQVNPALKNVTLNREELLKKLSKLNPAKSQGPDGLHPRVLRECAESIVDPLLILFKQSLQLGQVPSSWKQGNITPIFKKGKRTQVGNYRPVSLTSVCGKILEYFVRSSIVQHMTMNNLFCKDQHGFMEGRSCITQLLSVMEAWTEVLDNNLSIDTIYFDFQKAFDTVPHRRLLKKSSPTELKTTY